MKKRRNADQVAPLLREADRDLECVRKPCSQSLALRKQMIALAKSTKAR